MEKEKIEKRAKELLDQTKGFEKGSAQIVGVAKKLGFFVGTSHLDNGTEGIIAVDTTKESLLGTGRNKVIVVDSALEQSRRRFIIAHELGHYYLREEKNAPVFALRESSHGRDEKENAADFFAACILMPREHFKQVLEEQCKSLNTSKENLDEKTKYKIAEALSKCFDVPQLAALRRIDEVCEY